MRLNHCFEVIGCLKSLFYYTATVKFPPGLCDEQVTLQSRVETAQCRHKPISKFTCNSYEGNLSCLINSGLLRSRPSDAIKKSYLRHFPASISLKIKGSKLFETLHTCWVLHWSCCSQSLIIACEARTKDFHHPLKFCLSLSPSLLLLVLFNFPPFFTFFLGPFDWNALFFRYDLKVIFGLHNSVFKVILYYL